MNPSPNSTVQKRKPLTKDETAAIVAAVAAGRTQTDVAKAFGLHRNSVNRICKAVKMVDNIANPLARGYKPVVVEKAFKALIAGLDCEDDPYARGNLGLKSLYGTGEFVNGTNVQVDTDIAINISWGAAQEPEREPIDVTPIQDVVEERK